MSRPRIFISGRLDKTGNLRYNKNNLKFALDFEISFAPHMMRKRIRMGNIKPFALLGRPLAPDRMIEDCFRTRALPFLWNPTGGSNTFADFVAVFVFAEGNAYAVPYETVEGWIGHPHLRVIGGETPQEELSVLVREIEAAIGDEECERKFLVTYPDSDALAASPFAASAHIVQTYLLSENGVTERVRRRECGDGGTVYTHTEKRRIDRQTAEEREEIIDRAAYEKLLQRADPDRKPVEKTRWCILHGGNYFELDVYPFWRDRAIAELELSERGEREISFPSFFRVIREVTDDVRYKNARLAKEVPYDPIG